MVRTLFFCGACLLSCAATTFAQNYFCNAGVHPDAFIDWSKMPASPNPATPSFTATIPVAGAPGLSARSHSQTLRWARPDRSIPSPEIRCSR
jgi:hypothetical protein